MREVNGDSNQKRRGEERRREMRGPVMIEQKDHSLFQFKSFNIFSTK